MKIQILFLALANLCAPPVCAAETAAVSGTAEKTQFEKIDTIAVVPVSGIARHLRALQLVQDRMVSGNIKAVDAQRALLEQLLSAVETRNGLAAITAKEVDAELPMALLNGADPERVRAILGQSGIVSKDAFLLGALAYSEGRVSEAVAAFKSVEPAHLSPISRAQFYLTTGVLLAEIEPEKAIFYFAKAQLGAPGTLIEEAALRREALLQMPRPERFLPLVRSYLHRFAASPFASAFISQFAYSIGDLDAKTQALITSELDVLLAKARNQDRQNFYGILARSSLIGGNHQLADFATGRAVVEIKEPSQLLSARLYRAAFEIAGINHEKAAAELNSLIRVPLQASDREILAAAISIAEELRRWPYAGLSSGLPAGPTNQAQLEGKADSADNTMPVALPMTAAEKLLAETESLAGERP